MQPGMIFRMRRNKRKRRWRIVRGLAVGFFTTIFLAQLAAYGQSLSIDKRRYTKDHTKTSSPSYPSNWVIIFEKLNSYELTKKWHGFIDLNINLGLDQVSYFYSEYKLDPNLPPNRAAELERFRAGWPFKCLYWDRWTVLKPYPAVNFIGPHLGYDKEQTVQLMTISGFRTGLNFNSSDRTVRRFPVAPFWIGLIADSLFWCICWLIPGVIWRTIRTYRRKRRGLCLVCGYAFEDLGTCPECGVVGDQDRD